MTSLLRLKAESRKNGIANKKLSYRKQIARKLRTQYVEGI